MTRPRVSAWRRGVERVQDLLSIADWPARAAAALGLVPPLERREHSVRVLGPIGTARSIRIAFASDLHAGPSTPAPLLDRALAALEDMGADLLLLGGDFVSHRPELVDRVAPRLARIRARAGTFAVLGNHDVYAGAEGVAARLETAGIPVLTNRVVQLPAPFEAVRLYGLDEDLTGHPEPPGADWAGDGLRLVLLHGPSGLIALGDTPFDLAVCGHTHGGQIALPGGRPIFTALGPLSRRYNAGLYQVGAGRQLLVSRGIGCTVVPLRVNAPSEVHRITVTTEETR